MQPEVCDGKSSIYHASANDRRLEPLGQIPGTCVDRKLEEETQMKVLATGTAGFIGSILARRLHERVDEAVGIDNLNDYCKVQLKQARLDRPLSRAGFQFESLDIVERKVMSGFFVAGKFDAVVHLAAQAGVRHSINRLTAAESRSPARSPAPDRRPWWPDRLRWLQYWRRTSGRRYDFWYDLRMDCCLQCDRAEPNHRREFNNIGRNTDIPEQILGVTAALSP